MRDKVEVKKQINTKGEERILFFLHSDTGIVYLMEQPFTIGVYNYFKNGVSINQMRAFRYGSNKKLNHVIDRLPAYIKYVKDQETPAVCTYARHRNKFAEAEDVA